jgi:beta-glucosidase-like glycosyl hydrolase
MKKIVNFLRARWHRPPSAHYYRDPVLTDALAREMMKAYMGTGVRGRHF